MINKSMRIVNVILLMITFLSFEVVYSQESNMVSKKIDSLLSEYYSLSRENIYVHFDKDIYFTEENIWFKGYVYNQQSKRLFEETTNVFVELFNDKEELIDKKLLFSNQGVFQANIKIDSLWSSGKYYMRFYTNYMNNFVEDLSSTYSISIINKSDAHYSLNPVKNISNIKVSIYPESGVFLADTDNTVSVRLTDCYGNGVAVKAVQVLDGQDNRVVSFSTNEYGYGRFYLLNTKANERYRLSLFLDGEHIVEELPKAVISGAVISIVNYTSLDKVHFTVQSKNLNSSKDYFLLINQNSNTIVKSHVFKNDKKEVFSLDKSSLFEGVNTVRLIDEDLNLVSERLFFLYENKDQDFSIVKNYTKIDTTVFGITSKQGKAVLSASIYPEKSVTINTERNILNSLLINPYVIDDSPLDLSYFMDASRVKNFEIDLFFLHQKSSVNWMDIKENNFSPKVYVFERGLTLTGKLNQQLKNKEKYKVALFSIEANLNEQTTIDDNNEFVFENLILADSTWVNLSLIDSNNKTIPIKAYTRILNSHKPFKKPLRIPKQQECSFENDIVAEVENTPRFKDRILIEMIDVYGKSQNDNLKREKENSFLKGFKASDFSAIQNRLVVDFLQMQGFIIERTGMTTGLVIYSSRMPSTINSEQETTQIFIDDVEQFRFENVALLWMYEVDEIYLDRSMPVIGLRNKYGVVKIYTKSGGKKESNYNKNSLVIQVKNGFSKTHAFKNSNDFYETTFEKFGTLQWMSDLVVYKEKYSKLITPHLNQNLGKLFVEGITSEGTLISEIKTINLTN